MQLMNKGLAIRLLLRSKPYMEKLIDAEGMEADVSKYLIELLNLLPELKEESVTEVLLKDLLHTARGCCFFCLNKKDCLNNEEFDKKCAEEVLYDEISSLLHAQGFFQKLPKYALAS